MKNGFMMRYATIFLRPSVHNVNHIEDIHNSYQGIIGFKKK